MVDIVTAPLLQVRCVMTTTMTDAAMARDECFLDAGESERHGRFMTREDRRDYAAAHALLRQMLTAAVPGITPADWRFGWTDRGKPFLVNPVAGSSLIRFSLSHTRGMAVCAVSRHGEVGIDAECHSRNLDVELLMRRVCSSDEQLQMRSAAPSMHAQLFLDMWTLKEAYVKGCGLGIDAALDEVSFDLRRPQIISASLAESPARRWWWALIRPSAESRIAVSFASDTGSAPILDAAIISADGQAINLCPIRTSL